MCIQLIHLVEVQTISPNEFWLHTCDACVITTWRLALRAPLVARNNNIIYENNNYLKSYKYIRQ